MADQKRTWYQSIRGMPKTCEPKYGRIGRNCYKKYYDRNNDLWKQRRKEVLNGLNTLKIRSEESVTRYKPNTIDAMKKMKRAKCYICLTRGHAYWNCPNKQRKTDCKRKKTKAVKNLENSTAEKQPDEGNQHDGIAIPSQAWPVDGSDEYGWNDIWYISDEYPRHMTPNLETFKNFRPGSIGSSNTSKNGLDIQGFGEVTVVTGSKTYVIPGVYYVPNITLNILSLNQLMIQGFEVKLKNSRGILKRVFDDDCNYVIIDGDSDVTIERLHKGTKNEDLHKIDLVKEKAIRAIVKYYDSLYLSDVTIEEKMNGKHEIQAPTRNDFEGLIGFLEMVNEQEIVEGCKELVKDHFEKLVKWFYTDYMQVEERVIPVKISDVEICLLDLYLTVKGMGGHTCVTVNNKWTEVASAMGFPKSFTEKLSECYGTHLSLLGAYYELASHYSREDICRAANGVMLEEDEQNNSENGACHIGLEEMEGLTGNIEYDDGEKLIITFEEEDDSGYTEEECTSKQMEEDAFSSIHDGDSGCDSK